MSNSRRDFLKKAAILSGATGLTSVLPTVIQKAMAINAAPGTTFYDAEHVVFLMQENRSFDHMFGTLKGVRGFNDPRAKLLPDGDKVWVQKDKNGNAHAPFHIDINKTKITWQGGLPHGWPDQGNARNQGKYDRWIPEKTSMTMGYYDRSDIPFYYALADAFTICDHNFCSSLTGTTPNRLFFWTGNVRPKMSGSSVAVVHNSMAESRNSSFVDWGTFPELLEDHGVSWKIYQNELWTPDLQEKGVDFWLGNYGDNAIEYVSRHRVKLSAYFRKNGDHTNTPPLSAEEVQARYNRLSQREKNLIDKAFTTNIDDADDYLKLAPFTFTDDNGEEQTIPIPENDIFRQFRSDVQHNTLPAVSWLVAPQSFSEHTSTPFYGTWYVSEILNILTQNPEIWKKTIFIVNYDENDGYFDHLPPFVVPRPGDPASGKVSDGIDPAIDYMAKDDAPIGLGYRVPMIVASPWSKGGYVNSQVFDHTSALRFLETFLSKKTGKQLRSPNISNWRRTVCGDLTSVFRPYSGETFPLPDFLNKETVITNIQNAKNKPVQAVPSPLVQEEITEINDGFALQQEKGSRPACAIPYQLYADSVMDQATDRLNLRFEAGNTPLGQQTILAGAAFNMYTPGQYKGIPGYAWAYAAASGSEITDSLALADFDNNQYQVCIHGPNGFFRQFAGTKNDPSLVVQCLYEKKGFLQLFSGNIQLAIENQGDDSCHVILTDNAYKAPSQTINIPSRSKKEIIIDLSKSSGWYDFTIKTADHADFSKRYAGHVENGQESITDPYMGGMI